MPWQMPIQDGRQLHLLHQGQEHHKVIDALSCYLKLFFHALQYARKFRFCLAHYANGEYSGDYSMRGSAYQGMKEYEEALADFNRAIFLDPNNAPAYFNRGLCYLHQRDIEHA